MKRFAYYLIVVLVALVFISWFSAPVRAADWLITNFRSNLTVEASGHLTVVETITAVFDTPHHGIYRDLPHTYQKPEGGVHATEVSVVSVTRNGAAEPYDVSQNSANLRIQIGDPALTISGSQRYEITYRVAGVLTRFAAYDELYWNVTGDNWDVPINAAEAQVNFSEPVIGQMSCYLGQAGSTESCLGTSLDGQRATFASRRALSPGEGMTIAVGYKKGFVPILSPTSPATTYTSRLFGWPGLLLFAIPLAALLWLVRNRYLALGKDLGGKKEAVVPLYEPPGNLRPAELGLIIDERADTLDISATIVDLAVRGYLTIEELPKKWFKAADYIFRRTDKTSLNKLRPYEAKLLEALVPGKERTLSELRNTFYEDLSEVKKQLYRDATEAKLFTVNPDKARQKYLIIGFLITAAGIAAAVIGLIYFWWWLSALGAAATLGGMVLVGASFSFAQRSDLGSKHYRETLGYKLFVSNTEKYRQPFFEKEGTFMAILPYAIVFGVAAKLAKDFAAMGIEPAAPSWWIGAHAFNAAHFGKDIATISDSLSSVMASAPGGSGSGGGGFSGGGFGGGGGGGW